MAGEAWRECGVASAAARPIQQSSAMAPFRRGPERSSNSPSTTTLSPTDGCKSRWTNPERRWFLPDARRWLLPLRKAVDYIYSPDPCRTDGILAFRIADVGTTIDQQRSMLEASSFVVYSLALLRKRVVSHCTRGGGFLHLVRWGQRLSASVFSRSRSSARSHRRVEVPARLTRTKEDRYRSPIPARMTRRRV
jgi:hypothetical protein